VGVVVGVEVGGGVGSALTSIIGKQSLSDEHVPPVVIVIPSGVTTTGP
jgi:hypothetical protein